MILTRLRISCQTVLFSIFTSLSIFLTACVYDPVYYGPPSYTQYHPYYYDYYFYPTARVYFQFTTGYYFYWLDGRWVKSRVLPPQIHLSLFDRVRIKIQEDNPYTKFDEHIRLYKPRPDVPVDREKSLKEREANKVWYQEYEKTKEKKEKKPLKDKKEKIRPGMH